MATQENTWNVANRMHSLKDSDNPAVNHVISGADEIYDDAKGAKQSDINAQTDAALAERYTKSETYSKEQLDSLITTPDVNYVTVAAFADLPQTGEADTIYRVSSYDGTQVDASKYALYAWNGATYQLLATRSAIGEIFDVSEYNSGATYETLAAALAAVPESVQRGGMSIKFILRTNTGTEEEPVYHDEYVLYRLMNTDWSTVITDWQGVDKVPTPGSHNFVESGGVQNELALGAIYDVSAKNPTAGPNNDGKFESLSALLSDANLNTLIPIAVRKGGMSIKFVQSSDNKYVQFRYMKSDAATVATFTDVTNWQGVDSTPTAGSQNLVTSEGLITWSESKYGRYIENHEFLRVYTDSENKILWAIDADGSIFFGAGVPKQVIEYVQSKISELPISEYNSVVDFINGLEHGDKNLQDLLNEKLSSDDFDSEALATMEMIENPEWVCVLVDDENRIIAGVRADGSLFFGAGVPGLDGIVEELEAYIDEHMPDIPETISKLTGDITDLSSTIHFTDGYYISFGGNINSASSYRMSDLIQVKKGDLFIVSTSRVIGKTVPLFLKTLNGQDLYYPVMAAKDTFCRYVVDEDCYLYINARTLAYDSNQSFIWLRNEIESDYFGNEEFSKFFPFEDSVPRLANLNKPTSYAHTTHTTPITFLHFSDIHNSINQYLRILRFKDKFQKPLNKQYIDDVILTGDIAGSSYQIFNDLFLTADDKVLFVLGNHDTYKYYALFTVSGVTVAPSLDDIYKLGNVTYTVVDVSISSGNGNIKCIQSGGTTDVSSGTLTRQSGSGDETIAFNNVSELDAPKTACYNRYMHNISNWGVVQPANAAEDGKNYYYKDYVQDEQTVLRLIVVDCMFWDNEQGTWLTSVLDDAITNNIPVIGSQHFPLHEPDNINKILCPFSSMVDEKIYSNTLMNDSVSIVHDFVENGGEFVCWLCGHMHFDFTYWLKDYPEQLWLSVACAALEGLWCDHAWVYGTKAWDLFNLVSVDVHNKWLKVSRYGCKYNLAMQNTDSMMLDWNKYDDFDSTVTYRVGSVCKYNNKLYQFKFLHSAGAWNAEDVERYDRVITK